MKSLNFNSIQSVIITKLETHSRQDKANIKYQINTHSDGNLVPFNVFKYHFLGHQNGHGKY